MIDKDYKIISYIRDYCVSIDNHIQRFGDDLDVFSKDEAYFHSVTMCILQIGELSHKLSDEFINETLSKIPWGEIIGLRNKMAHSYGKINKIDIWDILKNDIPDLHLFCNETLTQKSSQVFKKTFNIENKDEVSHNNYDIDY